MRVLYCPADGWHPCLREPIERLRNLTDKTDDGHYWVLLAKEAGAIECDGSRDHLEGCMDRALRTLRSLEEAELRALCASGPENPPERGCP